MSGLFRRALASVVAVSFVLGQGGPELAATGNASPMVRPLNALRLPHTTVAAASPPVRVQVPEPTRPRSRPSAPPVSAIRPKVVQGVRPLNGRHVPGPPMLRPNQIDGVLRAAAAARRHASSADAAINASTVTGGRRIGSPGSAGSRPGAPPATRHAQSLPSDPTASGTGINPWWRYQEESVPGGGRAMVNVGTGNLLLQDDDMAVPHKGIAMAFRRTYNSQGAASVAHQFGSWTSLYGNGWTNTFDAHFLSMSSTVKSIYDIDGARYDYYSPPGNPAGTALTPITPGQHATLVFDGNCGWLWTKKSGTTYYFYGGNPTLWCPWLGTLGGYAGRLYQIIGRNRNTYVTFSYTWDNGDASATGKISTVTAQTESGLSTTLSFADVNGRRLLQQLTFPDNATSVSYYYDSLGNLGYVARPPNNAAGTRPVVAYGYQGVGGDSVMQWVASPRWMGCAGGCGYDGAYLQFLFSGTSAVGSTLNGIYHVAVVNPSIPDGTNTPLQPGYVPQYANVSNYLVEYYTTGVTTPTYRDSDGHMTNWVVDGTGRPTQTQECTASASGGQQCTGTWLLLNESWDANNELVATVDARGYETDFAYDANGNTIAVGEPQTATSLGTFRPTRLYDYDAFNNVTAYCDQTETHQAGADWAGAPAGSDSLCASAAVNVPHWRAAFTYPSYQPYGQLASMTTPLGYTHRLTYSPSQQAGTDFGLPTSVSGDPIVGQFDGTSITPTHTFWYDATGNLGCYSKGNGTWSLRYDSLSRLIAVADPDDTSLNAGSICGKSTGTAGWNTQTAYSYFPDGSKQTAQSPSERAFGVSTSFTYDLDGNVATETQHHGCVPNQACNPGTTQKWYDGADRLVEVALPMDPRSYSSPQVVVDSSKWVTRYWYDLSAGNTVTVTGSSPFRAYGNLYKTQLGYGSSWLDKGGSQFDGLDREVAKYSWDIPNPNSGPWPINNTLETTQLQYDAGSPAALGLLTTKTNPLGESVTYGYDEHGRVLTETYGGDSGRTANETYQFDPNGRAVAIASSQFGAQQNTFDSDGRLTRVTEPGGGGVTDPAQIGYSYYADGKRSAVSVTSPTFNQVNAIAYSYRADGLVQTLTNNAFAAGTWQKTYTDAGRPIAATGADAQHLSYDNSGQLQNFTLGTATMNYTHDPEGSPLTEVIPVPIPAETETLNYTYNVRGELVDSIYTPNSGLVFPHYRSDTGGGCATRASIPLDGSYVPGTTPPDPLVDSRTCATVSNGMMGSVDYNTSLFPSGSTGAFTFDTAGRLSTKVQTISIFTAPDPTGTGNKQGGGVPGSDITTQTTTNTLYDAENHTVSRWGTQVRTKTNPDTGSSTTTTTTRIPGAMTLGWGPNGHPALAWGGTAASVTLHWDGDIVLFVTDASGNVVDFKVGLDGEVTPRDTQWNGLTAYARDAAGVVIGGTTINGTSGLVPMDPSDGSMVPGTGPTPGYVNSASAVAKYTRADGFQIGDIEINGVRAFDPALGSWTTPDAFEGDIHDPSSQQKYMWNRGNPVDYSDPSGYSPAGDAFMAVANFVVLDDVNTLRSKDAPMWAKGLAVASLLSNFSGPGKGVSLGAKAALKVTEHSFAHAAERHFVENGAKASGKFAPGTTVSDLQHLVETAKASPGASFSTSKGNVIMEYNFGSQIGTSNGTSSSTLRAVWDGKTGDFITAFPIKN